MQSQDEVDLIKQAKKKLQLHKQATQRLSRCGGAGSGAADALHRAGLLTAQYPRRIQLFSPPRQLHLSTTHISYSCPAPTSARPPPPALCCRVEKGAIADRVLHTGHGEASFAQRLGALLRCGDGVKGG